jgi:hypothetical protein
MTFTTEVRIRTTSAAAAVVLKIPDDREPSRCPATEGTPRFLRQTRQLEEMVGRDRSSTIDDVEVLDAR